MPSPQEFESQCDIDEPSRLHPATILIAFLNRIYSISLYLFPALILAYFGEDVGFGEYFVVGMSTLMLFESVVLYATLRYGFCGNQLVINSGIIHRKQRRIPVDRIQDVNLQKSILHRVFRVVTLKLDTASGVGAEAELAVVRESDAIRLQEELFRRGAKQAQPGTELSEEEVLWSAGWKDLLLIGATQSKAISIVAIIVGLGYTYSPLFERFGIPFSNLEKTFFESDLLSCIVWVGTGVLMLLLVGWLYSIATSVIKFHGFCLRRVQEQLRRRYGLFTQYETTLRIPRIQVVKIDQPWLRRLMGHATIYISTAGSELEDDSEDLTPFCPLIRLEALDSYCRLLFSDLQFDALLWRPVHRRTILRGFIRYSAILMVLIAGFSLTWTSKIVWSIPFALLLTGLLAYARYRSLGYAEQGRFVATRSGILAKEIHIIPHAKIQYLTITRSPTQRFSELANLQLRTASKGTSEVTIVDLPLTDAVDLQKRLSKCVNDTGLWLPDEQILPTKNLATS